MKRVTKRKHPKGGRGVNVALARLTPQLSTATFNRSALENLGNPKSVIFYDLGEGRVIVQPYTKKTTSAVFDSLKKKKIMITGRKFSLSIRNGTAVFRTPSWLRQLKGTVVHMPVAGLAIKEYENCLYFDFKDAAETAPVNVADIAEHVGLQTAVITTFEETLSRTPKRTKKIEPVTPVRATAAPGDDDDEDDEDTWGDEGDDEGVEDNEDVTPPVTVHAPRSSLRR